MPPGPMTLDRLLAKSTGINDSAAFRPDGAGDVTVAKRGLGGRIVQFFTRADEKATRLMESDVLDDMRARFGDDIARKAFTMARSESRGSFSANGSYVPRDDAPVTPLTARQVREMAAYAKVLGREERLDVAAQSAMRYAPGTPGFAKIAAQANVPEDTLSANQKALYRDLLQTNVAATMQDPALVKIIVEKGEMRKQAIATLQYVATLDDSAIRKQRQGLDASQRAGEQFARALGQPKNSDGLTAALLRLQQAGTADASVASFGGSGNGDVGGRAQDMLLARAMARLTPSQARHLYERSMAPDGAGRALVFAAGVHAACAGDDRYLTRSKLHPELSHAQAVVSLQAMTASVLIALGKRGGIDNAEREVMDLHARGDTAGMAMLASGKPTHITEAAARGAGLAKASLARDVLTSLAKSTQLHARNLEAQQEATMQRLAVVSAEHRAIMRETRSALTPAKLTEALVRNGLLQEGEQPGAEALSAIRGLVIAQVSRAAAKGVELPGAPKEPINADLAGRFIDAALLSDKVKEHVPLMLAWAPDMQKTVANLLGAAGDGDLEQASKAAGNFREGLASRATVAQAHTDDRQELEAQRKEVSQSVNQLKAAPPPPDVDAVAAGQAQLAALEALKKSLDHQIATLRAAGDVKAATVQAATAEQRAEEAAQKAAAAKAGNAEAPDGDAAEPADGNEAQRAADVARQNSEAKSRSLRTALNNLNNKIISEWIGSLKDDEAEALLSQIEAAREHLPDSIAASSSSSSAPPNPLTSYLKTLEDAIKSSLGLVRGHGEFDGTKDIEQQLNLPDAAPAEALRDHPLAGGGTVSEQFWKDLDRCEFSLKGQDGRSIPLYDATKVPAAPSNDASAEVLEDYFDKVNQEKIRASGLLQEFIGNPQMAERVSQLVHQGALAPLIVAATTGQVDITLANGTAGILTKPPRSDGSGAGDSSFAISKEDDGAVRVDVGYSVTSATQFASPAGVNGLDPERSYMQFSYNMRITPDSVELIGPPTYRYALVERGEA